MDSHQSTKGYYMSLETRKNRQEHYFRKEKEAMALYNRMEALSKARWNFRQENLVKLERPIRRGWVRYFVIRKDLLHTNKEKLLNRILPLVQFAMVCDRKDFTTNKVDGKKLKKFIDMEQHLTSLYPTKLEELPDDIRSCFHMVEVTRRWGGPIKAFVFNWPWMFSLQVKPHWITHAYILHNEIIGEYEYIRDKLWYSDMLAYKFLNYRRHDSDWYEWTQSKKLKLEKILDKESREEVNEFNRGRRKYHDEWYLDGYYSDY